MTVSETVIGLPALARAGSTVRRLAMFTCERRTTMLATTGIAIANPPARARSVSPSSRPQMTAVMPAASRQQARVVKPASQDRQFSPEPRASNRSGRADQPKVPVAG